MKGDVQKLRIVGGEWYASLDADHTGYYTVNYGVTFNSPPHLSAACGDAFTFVNIGSPTSTQATLTCHSTGTNGSASGSWSAIGFVD